MQLLVFSVLGVVGVSLYQLERSCWVGMVLFWVRRKMCSELLPCAFPSQFGRIETVGHLKIRIIKSKV